VAPHHNEGPDAAIPAYGARAPKPDRRQVPLIR